MDDLGYHVNDDALAIDALKDLQWDVQLVSWRKAAINWDKFDLVVIRSPWDYAEHPDLFIESLETIYASGARLENSLEIVKWNIDKRYLLDLERKGINIVPTIFGSSINDDTLSEIADSFDSNSFIIKPVISAGAMNTFHINPNQIPFETINSIFGHTEYMAQPFMESILEEGEYSLFYFSGQYSHCVRKLPKSNDFRAQEEYGGHISAHVPSKELREQAQHVLDSLDQYVLYARIDLVRDKKGDYALMELELIEPSLYLRMDSQAPVRFAHAIYAI